MDTIVCIHWADRLPGILVSENKKCTGELKKVQYHARNLWLTSFYFAGMCVSDVLRLRWSGLQDNRLHYATGKNNKTGCLKIPDNALTIINRCEHLKRGKDDLIFPELRM